MSKEIIGDACAYVKGADGGKNKYTKIGIAFRDGDRISLKIDAMPIDPRWEGWVNIFPRELSSNTSRVKPAAKPSTFDDFDDDIPF